MCRQRGEIRVVFTTENAGSTAICSPTCPTPFNIGRHTKRLNSDNYSSGIRDGTQIRVSFKSWLLNPQEHGMTNLDHYKNSNVPAAKALQLGYLNIQAKFTSWPRSTRWCGRGWHWTAYDWIHYECLFENQLRNVISSNSSQTIYANDISNSSTQNLTHHHQTKLRGRVGKYWFVVGKSRV